MLCCCVVCSHLMKKKGQVAKAVDDLFGAAKFSRESERRETPLDFP